MENRKQPLFEKDKVRKYFQNQVPPAEFKTKMFEDPYFPPTDNSLLGKDKDGVFIDEILGPSRAELINVSTIDWMRAHEIMGKDFLLFEDIIEIDDIKQGKLENAYFLSALSAIAEYPNFIYELFRTKEINKFGYYEVNLYIDGEWQIVFVDDYFPAKISNKQPVFAKPNGKELWVMLLEKAWAKVNGGYSLSAIGNTAESLVALTGFAANRILHESLSTEELFRELFKYDQSHCIMCTSSKNSEIGLKKGLLKNHSYTLVNVFSKNYEETNIRLVKIRNPWGNKEWTGDWSSQSKKWNDDLRGLFDYESDVDDGCFFMSLNDFKQFFNYTNICEIEYEANVKLFSLEQAEIALPQVYNLRLTEPARVALSLIRKNWRFNRKSGKTVNPLSIVVGRIDENNEATIVKGNWSSTEDAEIVHNFKAGLYFVWFYCSLKNCQDLPPDRLIFRTYSTSTFYVEHVKPDRDFVFIRNCVFKMIINEFIEKAKNPGNNQIIADFENYKQTGLVVRAMCSLDPSRYYKVETSAKNMQNIEFLVEEEEENLEQGLRVFWVPPNGINGLIGFKTRFASPRLTQCEFKTVTKICQEGDSPVSTGFEGDIAAYIIPNIEEKEVNFAEYYTYKSSTIHEALKKKDFIKIDVNLQYYEELKEEYPDVFELLDKVECNSHGLAWSKQILKNGVYLGLCDSTGIRNAKGGFLFVSGNLYIGMWKYGKRAGFGRYYDEKKNLIYEGEFKNDLKHGQGTYYYPNGDVYKGNWENDVRNGKGIIYWTNGTKWVGKFENNNLHGDGILYFSNGVTRVTQYRNNKVRI